MNEKGWKFLQGKSENEECKVWQFFWTAKCSTMMQRGVSKYSNTSTSSLKEEYNPWMIKKVAFKN